MKVVFLWLIRFYMRVISPLHKPCCRFSPTCSRYAFEAIERFGALKGSFLAVKRFLRCNPFCKAGYDPVPLKTDKNELFKVQKNRDQKFKRRF